VFSLFDGMIHGRQIEVVPGARLVQAWRVKMWDPGVFSLVRFTLTAEGAGTKLVLDHSGFPDGQQEHLAAGWGANYWEPLTKYLG
jgi:activator of HSP90 ATPase